MFRISIASILASVSGGFLVAAILYFLAPVYVPGWQAQTLTWGWGAASIAILLFGHFAWTLVWAVICLTFVWLPVANLWLAVRLPMAEIAAALAKIALAVGLRLETAALEGGVGTLMGHAGFAVAAAAGIAAFATYQVARRRGSEAAGRVPSGRGRARAL